MARTVSRLTLRERIRNVADIENATDRHTDAFINECINQSYARLYDQLVITASDYNVNTSLFTTTAGTSIYSLPATFYKLRAIFIEIDGVATEMRLRNIQTPHNSEYRAEYRSRYTYSLVGNNVEIEPTPTAEYDIELRYTPAPSRMTADIDVIDGVAGWEEFVVWDVATMVKTKDNHDISFYKLRADEWMKNVIDKAFTRNLAEPTRIHKRRMRVVPSSRWNR